MARKVSPPRKSEPDELQVLVPHRTVQIQHQSITVRELGFFESLQLQGPIAALVGRLASLAQHNTGRVDLSRLYVVCGEEPGATLALVAQACDQPREWVQTLSASEGDLLLMTFWAVNADFFLQRVLSLIELQRHAPPPPGLTSSPP
jgi:hypothetical protein